MLRRRTSLAARHALAAAALGALLACVASACRVADAPAPAPLPAPVPVVAPPREGAAFIGRRMDFSGKRLDGAGALRLSDLRGKVVLVDVWAAWCEPCRAAVPVWSALRERLGPERFEVVGVGTDARMTDSRAFVRELAPAFPCVWDRDDVFVERFPVEFLPMGFVLDRDGVVRHVHVGYRAGVEAQVEADILALLSEPTPAPSE